MLDTGVENVLHIGQSGMRHNRPVAQGARPPLHSSLEPADDVARCDLGCDSIEQRFPFEASVPQIRFLQIAFNL